MPGVPLRTREAVETWTPAARATSPSRAGRRCSPSIREDDSVAAAATLTIVHPFATVKIVDVKTRVLLVPGHDPEATSSSQDSIVVEVVTDEGLVGIGET